MKLIILVVGVMIMLEQQTKSENRVTFQTSRSYTIELSRIASIVLWREELKEKGKREECNSFCSSDHYYTTTVLLFVEYWLSSNIKCSTLLKMLFRLSATATSTFSLSGKIFPVERFSLYFKSWFSRIIVFIWISIKEFSEAAVPLTWSLSALVVCGVVLHVKIASTK